jgi:predicted transposase YbfD/YdcC
MSKKSTVSLASHFSDIEDPRSNHTRLHLLNDIIVISICAVIAGAEGWEDIEAFGKDKHGWLKKFLKLPNGIPSHDTISRVFRMLKPGEFNRCFLSWTNSLHAQLDLKQIAIDGKSLRRSFDRASAKAMLHMVGAWSVENHLALGQVATDKKSNEITAIPELLRLLDLKGAIVTIDAMGCQKTIAKQIVDQGGDYVLAVKDNHPKLVDALREKFIEVHESESLTARSCRSHVTTNRGHGREETRMYHLMPVTDEILAAHPEWKKFKSIGQVINITTRDGKESSEVRFYISSLPAKVKQFAAITRGHWGIENSLHWVLDVTFNEDQSRIRKDHGPENFAIMRRMATTMIKRDTSKQSIKRKRKRAAWNNQFLLNILTQTT